MTTSSRIERCVSIRSVSAFAVSATTASLRLIALGALLQLVLVLEAGVEAPEVRPVPEHVGLLLDRDPARDPVLHEQRVADVPQHLPAPRRGAAVLGELARAIGSITSNTAATSCSLCARAALLASASAMTIRRSGASAFR